MPIVFRALRAAVASLIPVLLTLGLPGIASAQVQLGEFHSFSALSTTVPATNSDGATPGALVSDTEGNLYGTTSNGGANGTGTVFKSDGATFTTLHTFSAVASSVPHTNGDGAVPNGPLVIGSDGDLYGTTNVGGASGTGTVFKITAAGVLTTLHSFSASSTYPSSANGDGAFPIAGLAVGSDGNFYGTAQGGGASGVGTVFKITSTGTFTILASFDGPHGAFPYAPVLAAPDGNFYGTTLYGGADSTGVVFKITPSGALTTLHSFPASAPFGSADGFSSMTGLALGLDGDFYGTTVSGGFGSEGTVFKITPVGTLTTLYSFSALSNLSTNGDGAVPNTLLAYPGGDLYGTTEYGGTNDKGTVFRLTTSGVLTTLVNFHGADGAHPTTALALGPGGIFGTTSDGGQGSGVLFYLGDDPQNDLSWLADAVGAGASGTGTILWTRNDGAAGIWTLGASDAETAVGTAYGPFPEWSAKAVATARDGTSRVLWTKTTGEAGIWSLDAHGKETTIGPTYGPYLGWTAQAVGVAGDGTARVLWTNENGQAGLWSFSASDAEAVVGPAYGPFTDWTALSLATATDGTTRVLWDNPNGQMGLWTFDASDTKTVIGATYGPFPGWTATAVGAAGDGTARVLWTNANGSAGLWSFDASDTAATRGGVYGPYSQTTTFEITTIWEATAFSTASDGTSRVLWNDMNTFAGPNGMNITAGPIGIAGVWTFGANDAESVIGSVYAP